MKGADGTRQIGIVSMDGSQVRQLTHTGDDNHMPVFSPDGGYIAFLRGKTPNINLIVVDVATGEETVVATDAKPERRPSWRTIVAP